MDGQGLLAAIRADGTDAVSRMVYADWLDERGEARPAEFVRLHLDMRSLTPDHAHWVPAEHELSRLRVGLDAEWLAVIEPERRPLPDSYERPHCGCFDRDERERWKELYLHREVQDTECDAWKRLLDLIEDAASDGRTQLDLRQAMSVEDTMRIVTLPATIAKLKAVTHVGLYASHLVRIPPEIGEMTSLVDFDPYTSHRLHWLPYEITRCKNLVRSRVSTRVLYGNFKHYPPFPRLPRRVGARPVARRWQTPAIRNCSVCEKPFADEGRCRAWITLRVATDDLPLLVNACSRACIDTLPTPPERYAPRPHSGGLSPKHFRRRE